MAKKSMKATHAGKLQLGNAEVPCFVTEDGQRMISGRGVTAVIGMKGRGQGVTRISTNKTLNPYINNDLSLAIENPVTLTGLGLNVDGYEATVLADICESIQAARNAGALKTEQELRYAEYADAFFRSLAKVGLIALIDEATGYQHEREKDELQRILRHYISEELLPWQKKFPDVFYKELFRLNGWDYTVYGINKRPGVIGTWTKKLVYEQLPEGVLSELESRVPTSSKGNKTARFHQLLTDDIGSPHLTAQINQVVTLFQLSDNMQHMWQQFEKLQARQAGQVQIPFDFDDDGHTIDPPEKKTEKLSSFNQSLKQALDYNPKV